MFNDHYYIHPERTIWDQVKDFINEKQNGDIIIRKEIIQTIYVEEFKIPHNTISSYLNCLNQVGIINHASKPGLYIKVRDIPIALTMSRLKEIAFDKSWKRWFITLEDRIKQD